MKFFYILLLYLSITVHINIILPLLQVHSLVIRQSHSLQSVPPNISCTHLAPYVVMTALLTAFPMLSITCPWLFCNYPFVLLNPFTFSIHPLTPLSSGNSQSVLCIYESVYFVCSLILFLNSTCEITWNFNGQSFYFSHSRVCVVLLYCRFYCF